MAHKKGPISKVESFYINNNYEYLEPEEIASDLNRPIKSVENYIKKNLKKTKTESANKLRAGDQFVYQGGATVMTENASTLGDAHKARSRTNRNSNRTTKIK